MITVQINTPNSHNTKQFDASTLPNKLQNSVASINNLFKSSEKPLLKPSKSSVDLTSQDYDKYFTLGGRQATFGSRISKFIPPINFKLVSICFIWYAVSAVSSNISKDILRKFPHPTTLTEVQFLMSSFFCIITLFIINNNRWLIEKFPQGTLPNRYKFFDSKSTLDLIQPTSKIVKTTLPMGVFQFVGHITSYKATSVIPVSLVHSVKALSPLSTVLAYKVLFKVQYPLVTYITLIPLMVGVVLTCFSKKHSSSANLNFDKGIIYASISMLIFVSQNIFAKKILTITPKTLPINNKRKQNGDAEDDVEKIDKITILLYCSLIGFALTLPVYIISELTNEKFTLFEIDLQITLLFLLHGFSHFCQAMLAFHLIGTTTPVNYSIANILKRIVVIAIAIVRERESVNRNQGFGLLLTIVGLYAYDKWGMTKK